MKTFIYILAALIALVTAFAFGYILIWWGIVLPIATVLTAVEAGTLTLGLIFWQVVIFLLRGFVAGIVGTIGWGLSTFLFTFASS